MPHKAYSKEVLALFLAFASIGFGIRLTIIANYGSYVPFWDEWGFHNILKESFVENIDFGQLFQQAGSGRFVFTKIIRLWLFTENDFQWDVRSVMVFNSILWIAGCLALLIIVLKNSRGNGFILPCAIIILLMLFPISIPSILWAQITHNYTMILFSILGAWNINKSPGSPAWCLGVLFLIAAALTTNSAMVLPLSISAVYLLLSIPPGEHRKSYLITTCTTALIGIVFVIEYLLVSSDSTVNKVSTSLNFQVGVTSIMKTMSWPRSDDWWPAIIIVLPILFTLKEAISTGLHKSKLVRFSLSLYAYVFAMAILIYLIRDPKGYGPAVRYFEYISLGVIASAICLSVLISQSKNLSPWIKKAILFSWGAVILYSVPYLLNVSDSWLKHRVEISAFHKLHLNDFLNDKDESSLKGKHFKHVPYPEALVDNLISTLNEMEELDTLPYQLQKTHLSVLINPDINSVFKFNANVLPSKGAKPTKYQEETTIGSYTPWLNDKEPLPTYESKTIHVDRPYVMIPTLGYFGYPGTELSLLNIHSNEVYELVIKNPDSSTAEFWQENFIRVPRGYYQIVAKDMDAGAADASAVWFSFGAPRTVGRISFLTVRLLSFSHYFYIFGICLVLILTLNFLYRVTSNGVENKDAFF